ncbi:DDE_3 domain-containing protein [Trichonephila clavipes]|nr:DDE_3 domain-containing protein [Trichonephila clavipes]
MRGTLTGQRYFDDILRTHVGPLINGLPWALFQQDNARPHTARVAQDFLLHFLALSWPARSPICPPCEARVELAKTGEAINSSTQVSIVTPRKGKEKIPLENWTDHIIASDRQNQLPVLHLNDVQNKIPVRRSERIKP